MHCIKPLGHRLTARDFNRQITEAHIRVIILNRFTTLGIPLTHAVALRKTIKACSTPVQ